MKRLIVTNSDSGAGCIKASRIADKVVGLGHELVYGPAPLTTEPLQFFPARTALLSDDAEDWEKDIDNTTGGVWKALAEDAERFDRIELWMDPDPNSQLQLIQFLDWLREYTAFTSKLRLVHMDVMLGEQSPDEVAGWKPDLQQVENEHFELAATAWTAYRQPSPEAWHALLKRDGLTLLPRLSAAVIRMLAELPAIQTGLMSTQRKILELIGNGAGTPDLLLAAMTDGKSVFKYWRHGKMLDELARCTMPAVKGVLDGPFTLELHDDRVRHERYKRSSLSLTDFGLALLSADGDYARHNRIDRWWGGTMLTNERLWRWDGSAALLVKP